MKGTRLVLVAALGLLVIAGLLIGCQSAPAPQPTSAPAPAATKPAAAAPIELKFAIYLPPLHDFTGLNTRYSEQPISDMTGGRVKVKVYPGEALVKSADQLDAVQKGIVDISWTIPTFHVGIVPLFNLESLPFSYADWYGRTAYFDDIMPLYEQALQAKGIDKVRIVGMSTTGPQMMYAKSKQIKVPADVKGLKVRAVGAIPNGLVQGWGGAPVSMANADLYDNLSKGIVDAALSLPNVAQQYKLNEVVNYATFLGLGNSTAMIIVNRDSLAKLTPDDQKVLINQLGNSMARQSLVYVTKDDRYRAWIKDNFKGGTYTPTADEMKLWRDTAGNLVNDYITAAGPMGKQAVDTVAKYNTP